MCSRRRIIYAAASSRWSLCSSQMNSCNMRRELQQPSKPTAPAVGMPCRCGLRLLLFSLLQSPVGPPGALSRSHQGALHCMQAYILADTTYNSLSVDEVAAAHVDAQCVVSASPADPLCHAVRCLMALRCPA